MNCNNKSYKNNFDDIEVPVEADLIIEKAIKRAKNRHHRRFMKVSSGFAAILVLSLLLGKASPAFADYINNATTPIKNLFSNLEDKGINNAVKNGFVQEASKDNKTSTLSASDKGITINIDQVTISGNKLDIGYTLKADDKYKDFEDLYYDKFEVIDDKGKVLYDSRDNNEITPFDGYEHKSVNGENFKDTRVKQGIFEFTSSTSKLDEMPNSITIKFYDFSDNTLGYHYNEFYGFFYRLTHKSPKFIEGNWSITVKIDDKIKNANEIKYVKANETAENSDAKIEYVNLYPTTANAKLSLPKNMRITKMHLEDENGNKYRQKGGISYSGDTYYVSCPNFESPYFDKIKKLYLIFDSKENGEKKTFKIELRKE